MPYVALDQADAEPAPTTTIGQPVPNNGMTLLYMDGELEARLLGRTDVGSARRRTHINLAYTDLMTSLKIAECRASLAFDLVADQFLYRLPPCVFSILDLALKDDNEDSTYGGSPLDQSDLGIFRGRPVKSGTPTEFFHFSDMVALWPTPDVAGTVVIDFQVRPTWLTADAQCPILSIEWHEAILLGAVKKVFQALREDQLAMLANNDLVNFVRTRMDLYAEEQGQMVGRSSVPRVGEQVRRTRTRFTPAEWRRR